MIVDLTEYQTQIAVAVGVVLPLAVALVTKQLASSKFKNTVLLALSVFSSLFIPLSSSTNFDVGSFTRTFATTFGTAVLAYVGVFKPQGAADAIQAAVPGGIGTSPELPDPAELEVVDDKAVDLPGPDGE